MSKSFRNLPISVRVIYCLLVVSDMLKHSFRTPRVWAQLLHQSERARWRSLWRAARSLHLQGYTWYESGALLREASVTTPWWRNWR